MPNIYDQLDNKKQIRKLWEIKITHQVLQFRSVQYILARKLELAC